MSGAAERDIPEPPQIFLPIKAVIQKNGKTVVTVEDKDGVRREVVVITGKTTLTEVAIVKGISPRLRCRASLKLKMMIKRIMATETYTALKGINLGIERGELVTIIGASGSEKTTTITSLVCSIIPPPVNIFSTRGHLHPEFK